MKSSIVLLAILLISITASAQVERKPVVIKADSAHVTTDPGKKVDKQNRKERFKELDLTKEQKGKLKEITQSGKAAKEAIENNAALSEDDKKKQLRNHQREQAQKIQAILTPEQRAKFKASRPNNS
ncbi:MAG: hypothetical protein ABIN74_11445 [Ferruginibacter sp.]